MTDTLPGRSRTHLAGLLIVAAVLAVAACGGDSTTGGNGTTTQISANAAEFSFSPDSWVVAAGVEVTLRLQNDDSLLHTWVVLASPIELEGELSEELILFETSAEAGQQVTVEFPAPAVGTYQVICSIPGHFSAGMEGRLTVTGA